MLLNVTHTRTPTLSNQDTGCSRHGLWMTCARRTWTTTTLHTTSRTWFLWLTKRSTCKLGGENVNLCSFDIGVILYLDIILAAVTLHNTFFWYWHTKVYTTFHYTNDVFSNAKESFCQGKLCRCSIMPTPFTSLSSSFRHCVQSYTTTIFDTRVCNVLLTHTHTVVVGGSNKLLHAHAIFGERKKYRIQTIPKKNQQQK